MQKSILIVDDDKDTAESIKTVLEKEGFAVDVVHNGAHALQNVGQKNYAIIFMDIMMPLLSGVKVVKMLRERLSKKTVIVYCSAVPQSDVDLTDVDGFLQKPVSKQQVIGMTRRFIPVRSP